MTLLKVTNLSVSFYSGRQKVKAVDKVSYSLEKGQCLGIVGESGSGKSVGVMALMQLLLPASGVKISGEALFVSKDGNSRNLLQMSAREISKIRGSEIGMIFQEPMTSLNPVYKCGRQVAEAIRLNKGVSKSEARKQCLEWFGEVMLPDPEKAYDSYPHELSGGQKQRIMIAMAMARQPSLLIADEPTTALDVTVQKSILMLMKKLRQKYNMSLIFISHDLAVVSEVADQLLVVHKGKVVEYGSAVKVFSTPEHPYTKGLLACRPRMDVRLEKLPTVDAYLENKEITEYVAVDAAERLKNIEHIQSLPPVVRAKNLIVGFKIRSGKLRAEKFLAVKDVSLKVFPGETLGLAGESGCGKTTLGRALLRLIEADSGEIEFSGKNLLTMKAETLRKLRRDVQIIFQDPYSSLNPRITVGNALTEAMKTHGIGKNASARKKTAAEMLQKVRLESGFYHRYPHELSGGQRQRVCIARALVLKPRFIVCDESVSALDVSVQAEVLNLLSDLKKEYRFSLIFISHDLAVVKFISDRMMIMQNGCIVEEGDPDEIYQKPLNPYTQKLIDAVPFIRY